MKIGIVTFHSAHNYGAVLQAWSLQEYLRQQGYTAEIVNLRLPVIDKLYRLARRTDAKICGSRFVNKLANSAYYWARCTYWLFRPGTGKAEKYWKFEKFINKVLPVTGEYHSYRELRQAGLTYDALIAGSDQIWNAVLMKSLSPAYFLQFANEDAIRLSYAASIGTDEIPPQYKTMFRCYLRNFDSISVRENKAKEEIGKLTDLPVDVVADPTFLLRREDFDKLRSRFRVRSKKKYIYVHNVHLNRLDEALNGVVEEMSKRLGLPVIHNWGAKVFSNEAGHFTGGIGEFLDMVSGAEYVVTNSFHCTIFAIIYHRDFITVPHYRHPDRMRNLLESLGIPSHLVEDAKKLPEDLSQLAIDYQAVEEKKAVMGRHAEEFLRQALAAKRPPDNRTYLETGDKFRCYGCGACKDACPEQAIQMEEDEEGFLYPAIREDACSHCGKCKDACIYHRSGITNPEGPSLPVIYAAYHKDSEVLARSSSGGAFTAMYRKALEKGGYVAGVCYGGDMRVIYDIASDEEGCLRFCGSKNVYADSMDVKPQVKQLLEEGRWVLFTGTPCQIAGLKSFLGGEYPRLYTVELICSGGGSPKIFRQACEAQEELYKSKIVNIQFHNKFKGAAKPFVVTEFASGSVDVEDASTHSYNQAFRRNLIQRPACYICEFAGPKPGTADITMGSYLGVERSHPGFGNGMGVSLLKVNTEKGRGFFEEFKGDLTVIESSYDAAFAGNRREPIQMGAARIQFMYEVDGKSLEEALVSLKKR